MTQNYLFPCNFVQIMTDHVYVHSIIPTGPGTCVFKCMMLISEPANTDKAKQYWEKNYNVVKEVFNEDFEIARPFRQACQLMQMITLFLANMNVDCIGDSKL